jgi:Uri superfamily endonuclease
MDALQTYQLHFELDVPATVTVGRFGTFLFPAGRYVYTGSAKRNLEARIRRHLATEKKLKWHIDYLLAAPGVHMTGVKRFSQEECPRNQATAGKVIVPGFGASDCRNGCGSHLKFLGPRRQATARSRAIKARAGVLPRRT